MMAVARSGNLAHALEGRLVFPGGTGAVARAVRHRRPVASPDVLSDPTVTLTAAQRAGFERADFRAVLAIPLPVGDDAIGVLSVGDRPGRTFSAEETGLVRAFADLAAIAMHRSALAARVEAARAAAQAAEGRLAELLDGLDAIIWEADARSWRYSFVSRGAEVLLGYPVDRSLRDPEFWAKHLHPDDRQRALDFCRAEVAAGRDHELEYRLVAADGRPVWLRSVVRVVTGAEGRPERLRGVMVDVSAMKRADAELRRSQDELRALSARLESVQEEERGRIAREIHDELGQVLTGLKMDLAWLAGRLPDGSLDLGEKVAAMGGLVDGALQSVRRIAAELRPALLDTLGLAAAIERQAAEFQARTGIPCTCTTRLGEPPLDPALAAALFRIFQEALTNVARHAGASRVAVRLVEEGDNAVLEVRDNGRGITVEELASQDGLGITGMRERARALGGDVAIIGTPAAGTRVTASLPRRGRPRTSRRGAAGACRPG
jgi:PAS domain S-box-containing protein